jgi:flagellar motor switch protein FliG
MDKLRNAAIIMLGMGEKCAAEVLKNMDPKEVHAIIDAINGIDNISEYDVIKALNEFFIDSNDGAGVDIVTREYIKNSLVSAVEHRKIGALTEGVDREKAKWLELLKWQPLESIVTIIQDEHPQIIAVIVTAILNGEKSSRVIKSLPKELQNEVIMRMTNIGAISAFAMEALSSYIETQLENSEKYNPVSVDGIEAVANIMSYLDMETEAEIISNLSQADKLLTEKIQEKMFPFEKLAQMDGKSLQTLLKEVKSEDLVLALKGVDEFTRSTFMKNMSTKAAEILKDEMEIKGPVKLANVLDAQKRIIVLAKQMNEEEKIILSGKNDPDVVY